MSTLATLVVKLTADTGEFVEGLGKADKGAGGFLDNVKKLGAVSLAGIGAGLAAVGGGIALAVNEMSEWVGSASEAEDIQAQLNSVLESTAGVAGVTADQVNDLATALSDVTKFEDDSIVAGENMLLTFTNIGKNVFPDATETMLDMSQALGQDMKGSAIQLGKALNDPILGVTALRKVGVNFTEAQQDMIASLVEAGKLEEAQKLILKELQTEFGGSARAAGQTFAGQMEILNNKIGNVKEGLGGALLPILMTLVPIFGQIVAAATPFLEDIMARAVPLAQLAADTFGGLLQVFLGLIQGTVGWDTPWEDYFPPQVADTVYTIVDGVQKLVQQMQPFIDMAAQWISQNVELQDVLIALGIAIAAVVIPALISVISAAAPVIAAALALIAIVVLLRKAWESDFLGIRTFILQTLQQIQAWWAEHGDAVVAKVKAFMAAAWATIQTVFNAVMGFVQTALATIKAWWAEHGDEVVAKVKAFMTSAWATIQTVFTAIQTFIQSALTTIRTVVSTVLSAIQAFWQAHGATIMTVATNVWTAIKNTVQTIITVIQAIIAAVTAAIHGDWYTFGAKMREAWNAIWNNALETLKLWWANVKVIVADLIASIIAFFTNTDWGAVGKGILEGIAKGITGALDIIKNAATSAAKAAFDAAKGFLGIKSPSTKGFYLGEMFGRGQAKGILSSLSAVERASQQMGQQSLAAVSQQTSYERHYQFNISGQFEPEPRETLSERTRRLAMLYGSA